MRRILRAGFSEPDDRQATHLRIGVIEGRGQGFGVGVSGSIESQQSELLQGSGVIGAN